jgi:hypothetical protein
MRLLIAGFAFALMTAAAHAQVPSQMNNAQSIGKSASKTMHEGDDKANQAKVKANEKAYNAALHNLPDKQYDPWHGVR